MKKTIFWALVLALLPPCTFAVTPQETTNYRIVIPDIESGHLEDQLRKNISKNYRTLLCDLLAQGTLISGGNGNQDREMPKRATIVCSSKNKEGDHITQVISSSLFKVDKGTYLVFAKAIDKDSGAVLRTRSVEHHGGLETLDESLKKLAHQMANKPDELARFKRAYMKRSKWHIAALSVSVAAILLAYDTTAKYNDLSSENSRIRSDYLMASVQEDIDRYKSQYNDNIDKMEEHEQTINYLTIIVAAALSWEAYMLYQTYKDSRQKEQNIISQSRFHIAPISGATSQGLTLSFSWKF